MRIYEELVPSDEYGFLLAQLGFVNLIVGRYEAAINYSKESSKIFNLLGNKTGEADAIHILSMSLLANNEFDEAISYYYKALSMRDSTIHHFRIAAIYFDLGMVYINKYWKSHDSNQLADALLYLSTSREIRKKCKCKYFAATPNYWTGYIYIELGNPKNIETGIDFLNQTLRIIEDNTFYSGDLHLLPMIYHQLGQLSFKQDKYDLAKQYTQNGIDKAKVSLATFSMYNYPFPFAAYIDRHRLKMGLGQLYNLRFAIDTSLQDYESALKSHLLKEHAFKDFYEEENRNLIAVLEAESINEKTTHRIENLATENEIKDLKIERFSILVFGLIGFLIVILFIAILFVRQHKIKAEHKTIALEQKLLRLQMNPHFIFNALSNILNLINRNSNETAAKYLTRFSKLLRNTLEGSRKDTIKLDAEIEGLANYLELQKLRFGDKFDFQIDVDDSIDTESTSIPPLLVQPFIENAIEHGIHHKKIKGHVYLRFMADKKQVICEVEDDGVGRGKAWELEYSKRKDHDSLATQIIKERIKVLNKTLKGKINLVIKDLKDEMDQPTGTKVILKIPTN